MKTTIDGAGRVVIPKAIRTSAKLARGTKLNVRLHKGVIEIEPMPVKVRMERKGEFLVATRAEGGEAKLTQETVNETIESVRSRE